MHDDEHDGNVFKDLFYVFSKDLSRKVMQILKVLMMLIKKGILVPFCPHVTIKLECQSYFTFSSLRFSQYYICSIKLQN